MPDPRVDEVQVNLESITVDVSAASYDDRLWSAQCAFANWIGPRQKPVTYVDIVSLGMLPSALGPRERFKYVGALRPPHWANR